MKKKKLGKTTWLLLLAICVVSAAALALSAAFKTREKKESYDEALSAAMRMQSCMELIKKEKTERKIALADEDIFGTGLIGEDYNDITTTSGDLPAKRTCANPDMAAMMVFMLKEAGVGPGDCVGCNFSGSFPSLNIAVICACDEIGAKPVYISACGSSTWGANNPGLSFPEMAHLLYKANLISEGPVLITPGGSHDTADGFESDDFKSVWDRVGKLGYPTYEEADFEKNVAYRKSILDKYDIDCFVAVGGHLASLGKGDTVYLLGQGLIKEETGGINPGSGLIEMYLNEGIPTALLLNIKKLALDYSLPFDPDALAAAGESGVYYENVYPVYFIIAGIAICIVLLIKIKLICKLNK